jgi:hypothetical protein
MTLPGRGSAPIVRDGSRSEIRRVDGGMQMLEKDLWGMLFERGNAMQTFWGFYITLAVGKRISRRSRGSCT